MLLLAFAFASFLPASNVGAAPLGGGVSSKPAAKDEALDPKKEIEIQRWFVDKALKTPLHRMTWAQSEYFVNKVKPELLTPAQRRAYYGRRKAVVKAGLHIKPEPPKKKRRKRRRKKKKKKPEADPNSPEALARAGYEEIEHKEVRWLSKETKCSEKELTQFSTLKIVPGISKDGEKGIRYFLQNKDPLFAAVANFRKGRKKIGGTRTFGTKVHSYCKGS